MSNSPLVSYTRISPNKTSPRNHKIDTITIHCVVGQLSVENLGNVFAPTSRKASSNYGIGPDGRIGMYVEESDRSWCSSNAANDNRAITIEVASDTTHPYAVKDKALKALINLVADICERNGIEKLLWKGDRSLIGQVDKQNMTVHRWFANKACPGDYLYERHSYIADEVNKILGSPNKVVKPETKPAVKQESEGVSAGKKLTLKGVDLYTSASVRAKSSTKSGTFYVWSDEVVNGRVRITNKKANVGVEGQVTGWIDVDVVNPTKSTETKEYKVKVTTSVLNIRKGPGTNYGTSGSIRDRGVYTIVEESKGAGSTNGWGKLKSGAGWISLDFATRI